MGDLFWTNQNIYIENIYKPVILGTLICFVAIAAVFAFGLFRHYQLLLMGGKENRFDQIPTRIKTALTEVFAQMRIIKEPYPGIMHLLIFWGTALFIIGKLIRPFSYAVDLSTPPQAIFLYASLMSEIGALMIIVGGLLAIYRRYIAKPTRLDTKPDDTLIYVWVFIILLTGFMAKGYRIAAGGVQRCRRPAACRTRVPV